MKAVSFIPVLFLEESTAENSSPCGTRPKLISGKYFYKSIKKEII
jgi:hypothetical protein